MPYFKNENVNILLIHIPKTGGTSLQEYFSKKFDISLNNSSLYDFLNLDIKEQSPLEIHTSLQHMTYNTIMKYKDFFNIKCENLEIITIIRNPYYRVISDLFFISKLHDRRSSKYKIDTGSSKYDVYIAIQEYIRESWDNHGIPQYLFLLDENNNLLKNIKIIRTEYLQSDMIRLGYTDFDVRSNCNENNINYNNYLNTESLNLINKYYEKDFELFGYTKMQSI
jgi:hypothetical protein